uniref:Uncharacterized protein n=1 Tax=Arundo donax TaxID=35708 RepID=A0A0A8ZWU2_ARUDO
MPCAYMLLTCTGNCLDLHLNVEITFAGLFLILYDRYLPSTWFNPHIFSYIWHDFVIHGFIFVFIFYNTK